MARESLPDAIAFEQSPGGSQGVVLADIQEKGIPAEGTGSAKPWGQNVLVSGSSEQVRGEWQWSDSRSCRILQAPIRTLAFLLNGPES